MTQYVFRLATANDLPDIRRLQAQFIAEMHDPLGVDDGSHARSEFVVLEVADERGRRVVGITSLMRGSPAPFVFEQVFPEVWERLDLHTLTGRADIGRDDLVENDWGYLEREYRRRHLGVMLWAGCVLAAHRQGYPVLVGIGNPAAVAAMGDDFRVVGPETELSGVRYRLGVIFPTESAPRMTALVDRLRVEVPGVVWQLPGLEG